MRTLRRTRVRVHDEHLRPAGVGADQHGGAAGRCGIGCWAPEIAAIAGSRIGDPRNAQRLLANTLAHQWWGSEVSPATLNDAWITNGMSRYARADVPGGLGREEGVSAAITDVSAGALAYDTEPLTTLGRLDPFSPQFQSMTLEKGAMVFHMLRWEMGDDAFHASFCAAVLIAVYGQGRAQRPTWRRWPRRRAQLELTRVLLAVAGRDGRAGVYGQVSPCSGWATTRASGRRVDHRGPGPVPHAGGAADRDGRKDGDTGASTCPGRSRRTRWRRLGGRGGSRSIRRTGC